MHNGTVTEPSGIVYSPAVGGTKPASKQSLQKELQGGNHLGDRLGDCPGDCLEDCLGSEKSDADPGLGRDLGLVPGDLRQLGRRACDTSDSRGPQASLASLGPSLALPGIR